MSPGKWAACTLFAFVLLSPGLAVAGESSKKSREDIDPIALASLLIRDGHYNRAQKVLQEVDTSADSLDKARFYTLQGLVHLELDNLASAVAALEEAIAAGQQNKVVYVYLAQAHFRLKQYRPAIAAIKQVGEVGDKYPSLYLMWAQAHWELDEQGAAWRALERGRQRFPANHQFLRRQVFYLIDLGLYRKAAEVGRQYLQRTAGAQEDYIAIGNALRRSGQLQQALKFFESAHLRYPDSKQIVVELAHVYLEMNRLITAAELLEWAAVTDPGLLDDAAEVHRQAEQLFRALNLNSRVTDQKKKLKQRLAILLALKRYEMVSAMGGGLKRVGLIDDQDIRYALAYSMFKSGEFEGAERHLSKLTDSELFRKAAQLRKAMTQCRDERWRCY